MFPAKQRENNRAAELMDAAARLFAEQGYARTTIRDVTSTAGMGPGSSYYHFESKADLLLAVYAHGTQLVTDEVTSRIEGVDDSWARLGAALEGHVTAVLAPSAYVRVIVNVLPGDVPEVEAELRSYRDGFERLWRDIIEDLDLDPTVDRHLLRLFLLGAANATQTWYEPGDRTPAEIAAAYVAFLRDGLASNRGAKG